jgi:hypothetical protein
VYLLVSDLFHGHCSFAIKDSTRCISFFDACLGFKLQAVKEQEVSHVAMVLLNPVQLRLREEDVREMRIVKVVIRKWTILVIRILRSKSSVDIILG